MAYIENSCFNMGLLKIIFSSSTKECANAFIDNSVGIYYIVIHDHLIRKLLVDLSFFTDFSQYHVF